MRLKTTFSLLAIGLVIATTLAVGLALKLMVPSVPWAAAFVLGTRTSPPPPTIESRNPASREAREMTASSMRWIVASAGQHERY